MRNIACTRPNHQPSPGDPGTERTRRRRSCRDRTTRPRSSHRSHRVLRPRRKPARSSARAGDPRRPNRDAARCLWPRRGAGRGQGDGCRCRRSRALLAQSVQSCLFSSRTAWLPSPGDSPSIEGACTRRRTTSDGERRRTLELGSCHLEPGADGDLQPLNPRASQRRNTHGI